MKKIIVFIFFFLFLTSCSINYDEVLEKAIDSLEIDEVITTDINFIDSKVYNDLEIKFSYTTSSINLTEDGIVTRSEDDELVSIIITASYNNNSFTKTKEVTILGIKGEVLEEASKSFVIETELRENLFLKQTMTVLGYIVSLSYFSNDTTILSHTGVIRPSEEETKETTLRVTFKFGEEELVKEYNIKVLSYKTIVDEAMESIVIPEETSTSITLQTKIQNVICKWSTNMNAVIKSNGVISYVSSDVVCKLSVYMFYDDDYSMYSASKDFYITVKPFSSEVLFEKALSEVSIDLETNKNLNLKTSFSNNVSGVWTSSNETVLASNGNIYPNEVDNVVILTLTLTTEQNDTLSIDYSITVLKKIISEDEENFLGHNLVDRASGFVISKLNNLVINNNLVELSVGSNSGYYESKEFLTHEFSSVVGSFSCTTSVNATANLEVSVFVNNKWSKYFSYGDYGLGKKNLYYDSSDTYAYLSTDEIIVSSSYKATKVKYKITLKRDNPMTQSPKLSIVSLALLIPNYVYNVDTSTLPTNYDIDVPKLYQHDVPGIGGVICSATTSTMLLKYKGFSFLDKGYTYEHEYIATLVADPGHNNPTYGNWSYNMITVGAFGVDAYVARMYSFDEIKYHLVNVGPIGCSIKGNFGIYTTGGHLIVVRGYKVVNQQTYVICNDPNVKGVYYEVSLSIFLNAYRGVSYVVL